MRLHQIVCSLGWPVYGCLGLGLPSCVILLHAMAFVLCSGMVNGCVGLV